MWDESRFGNPRRAGLRRRAGRADALGARGGMSQAVIVGPVPLLHTTQLLPLAIDGKLVEGDASAQLEALLTSLGHVLRAGHSEVDRLVKLNFYVADDTVTALVERALAMRFSAGATGRLFCRQCAVRGRRRGRGSMR